MFSDLKSDDVCKYDDMIKSFSKQFLYFLNMFKQVNDNGLRL